MRGITTCMVLMLSTAVAPADVGRLVNKRWLPMSQEMALAGGRYQLNPQEDRAMDRRYQLDGQKDATSNEGIVFKSQKK